MFKATTLTYLTIPCRLIALICAIPSVIWVFRSELFGRDGYLRWAVWQVVGLFIEVCVIVFVMVLTRNFDLSMLNPATYSPAGWAFFVGWHCFWVWMWVNE